MKRIVVVRVAINLEQLLYRVPGGVGRYTARLANLLPRLFGDDDYQGFVARHSATDVDAAMRENDVRIRTSPLPFPRPVLYDAWHTLGAPRLAAMNGSLRGLDL